MSLERRKIGSRIFAEAPRLSSTFLPLQLRALGTSPLIIPGREILGSETPLLGDHRSNDPNRTTHHHPRNGASTTCGASLVDPCHSKARFQRIVGAQWGWGKDACAPPPGTLLSPRKEPFETDGGGAFLGEG